MNECVKLLQKDNPEFEYHLYDDNDCIEFIKNHFNPDVLWAFQNLIPGAYKADLWRYCILYINGGIYIDIKYKCINEFKLKCFLDKEYYVLDRYDIFYGSKKGIYNGLMICKPNNPLLFKLINRVVYNVKNKFYGINSLNPTGPVLFAYMYEKYVNNINRNEFELKYSSDGMNILYNDIPVLELYKEYRSETNKHQKVSHYGKLWYEKKIYKE
jgi:mannosyltransferase OCH1-like enzyme